RQVEHDAALAAVVHLEWRAEAVLDAEHPAEHARGIAVRRLDLDDVGAPVGEYSAGRRTGYPDAEFDDLDALQRSGHHHPFREPLYNSRQFCKHGGMNRVPPIVGLASHLGRGVQRIATDAVVGRVRSLPRTVGDLDAKALSQIMGRTVTSVVVIAGDAGTSSRARLALTGDAVPASVFVKMPAETTATRLMGELGRLADTETRFYSQLAPELTGLPKAYGSAFDPLTGRFVLVLEDLAADNCEFPDTLHPLDRGQAGAIVELLARLHATFWG